MTGRSVGLVAPVLVIAIVLGACSDREQTDPEARERRETAGAEACEPADFAPTYLPWEKSGSIPDPETLRNDRDTVLLWLGRFQQGQPTAKADLATHYEATDKGGEVVPVRGTQGRLSWTGGQAQEWGLRWTERDEPCGHYGLFFTDLTLSKEQSKAEILRVAESLE